MDSGTGPDRRALLEHVLLPVANEADARESAQSLAAYEPTRVTAVHVIEKGDGVPDTLSAEQAEQLAADSIAAVREVLPAADDHTAYSRDVVAAIFEAAAAVDASAIAFRPREGGRLMQFLSGDRSLRLVTEADRPVIALPRSEPSE